MATRAATPLHVAEERMANAKSRFSLAALACLRGAPDAAELVSAALGEVEAARIAVRLALERMR